ncbi:MAG: hypothetical protein OER97_01325 [Gammaproteobacteria bacterium]|nr:hypothetical protein [Gammaproteobacteria bacterium]
MTTTVTRLAVLFAAILALSAIVGCAEEAEGPEAQVRAWIDEMHAAAEAKDRSDIVDRISPSYIDARGNSRDDIENTLRVYFLRQNRIAVVPNVDEIRIIDGTVAEVSLTVAMAGTNNNAFGLRADAYRFELELEADGEHWKLISARWGEVGQVVR